VRTITVGEGRARDVAAEPLELVAIVDRAPREHRETGDLRAARPAAAARVIGLGDDRLTVLGQPAEAHGSIGGRRLDIVDRHAVLIDEASADEEPADSRCNPGCDCSELGGFRGWDVPTLGRQVFVRVIQEF